MARPLVAAGCVAFLPYQLSRIVEGRGAPDSALGVTLLSAVTLGIFLSGLFIFSARDWKIPKEVLSLKAAVFLAAVAAVLLAGTARKMFGFTSSFQRLLELPFLLVLFSTLFSFIRPRLGLALLSAVAVTYGVGMRAFAMASYTLEQHSDMLPLVRSALTSFFQGENPYRIHDLSPWFPHDLPLTYLPAKWLFYAPCHMLGLDLRWMNVLCEAGVLSAGSLLFLRLWKRKDSPALAVWTVVFLSYAMNPYFSFRLDSEVYPLGAGFLCVFVCLRYRRFLLASILAGVLVCMSQLAWVALPLPGLWMMLELMNRPRNGLEVRRGLFRVGVCGLVFIGTALLISGPFLIRSADGMREGIVDKWKPLEAMGWAYYAVWMKNLNLVAYFYQYEAVYMVKYIQSVLCAGSFLIAIRYRTRFDLARAWWSGTALLTLVLALNSVVWTYLYQPVLIMAGCGVYLWCSGPADAACGGRPGTPWGEVRS